MIQIHNGHPNEHNELGALEDMEVIATLGDNYYRCMIFLLLFT
jgi:hypothetical protein